MEIPSVVRLMTKTCMINTYYKYLKETEDDEGTVTADGKKTLYDRFYLNRSCGEEAT